MQGLYSLSALARALADSGACIVVVDCGSTMATRETNWPAPKIDSTWFTSWPPSDRAMMWAEIRAGFASFVDSLATVREGVRELRLLMRAVNAIALRFPIKQPRWRAGRWKSKT